MADEDEQGRDWRAAETYRPLLCADASSWAWEFARRGQVAEPGAARDTEDLCFAAAGAAGVEGPLALWRFGADPSIPVFQAEPARGGRADAIEVAALGLPTLVVTSQVGDQHVLVADGPRRLRFAVTRGDVLEGPVRLGFMLPSPAGRRGEPGGRARAPGPARHRPPAGAGRGRSGEDRALAARPAGPGRSTRGGQPEADRRRDLRRGPRGRGLERSRPTTCACGSSDWCGRPSAWRQAATAPPLACARRKGWPDGRRRSGARAAEGGRAAATSLWMVFAAPSGRPTMRRLASPIVPDSGTPGRMIGTPSIHLAFAPLRRGPGGGARFLRAPA